MLNHLKAYTRITQSIKCDTWLIKLIEMLLAAVKELFEVYCCL